MIYFDTASSYPVLPEVKKVLIEAFDSLYANSASSHFLGEKVSLDVDNVRELIADEIGAYPSEVIFTSGATESNNIAFKSILFGDGMPADKKHIITSQIEHKCIFSICHYLESLGYEITYIKPNKQGVISPEAVKNAITSETALVSIMHVNNELGTINPISEIGAICQQNEILFHSDAAQSLKKVDIDVDDLNVDIMSFSAHKIGGPKGIGAIYIRDLRSKQLMPVIHGAGQEGGVRGGTVAAPLIMGFGSAIENFSKHYNKFKQIKAKEFLLSELEKHNIEYQINGGVESLPSCLSLTLPLTDIALLIRDNEQYFCLAQGSACSSKEIAASHVLTAIGLTREQAEKTFRISFPLDISKDNVLNLVETIQKYYS
ncbi:MAG: cysteine desulfurase [Methylococcaceae bacterium]|nr:cysteine desulfurase [Methylococcaceae bacterium]